MCCCFHRMDLQNVQILNKVIVVIDFYLNSRIFPAIFYFKWIFSYFLIYKNCIFVVCMVWCWCTTAICVRPCACSFQFSWYSSDIYIYDTVLYVFISLCLSLLWRNFHLTSVHFNILCLIPKESCVYRWGKTFL